MTRTLVKSTLAMALLLPLEAPLIEAAQQFDAFVRFLHRLPVPATAQHLDLAAGDPLAQRAHRLRRRDEGAEQGEAANRPWLARRQVHRDDGAERMGDQMGTFLPARGEDAQRRLHEAVYRQLPLDAVRAPRPRQIEPQCRKPREGGEKRRPGVRRAAQPMDHEHGVAAADRRVDLERDALYELGCHARLTCRLRRIYATEAGRRLRAVRISGALWKTPFFITARSRLGSCRIAMLASGSPSTSSRSAK